MSGWPTTTIDPYTQIKLGSWTIAHHFSLYFASIASRPLLFESVSPLAVSLVNMLSLASLSVFFDGLSVVQ